jgi:aspartokinase-like uncharacterized kinase
MWVVKVGGSLCYRAALAAWLDQLGCYGLGQVVIVPGGGPFADQVRAAQDSWGFADAVAHRMAMQGMDQFGQLMMGLRPDLVAAGSLAEVRQALANGQVPVWMAGRDPAGGNTPASWDVTSDSLAAFLAERLGAEHLVLVKRTAPRGQSHPVAELSRMGYVDPAFRYFLAPGADSSAWIVEEGAHEQLREMLYMGLPLGVRVVPSRSSTVKA